MHFRANGVIIQMQRLAKISVFVSQLMGVRHRINLDKFYCIITKRARTHPKLNATKPPIGWFFMRPQARLDNHLDVKAGYKGICTNPAGNLKANPVQAVI